MTENEFLDGHDPEVFQELRRAFIDAEAQYGHLITTLEIRVPDPFIEVGDQRVFDPIRWDVIAWIRTPTCENPSPNDFTLIGQAALSKPANDVDATRDSRIKFKELCRRAGAALPDISRQELRCYLPAEDGPPLDWFLALMLRASGKVTPRVPKEEYCDSITLDYPFRFARQVIDAYQLTNRRPGWTATTAGTDAAGPGNEKNRSIRKATADELMKRILQREPDCPGWTITQWTRRIKCGRATIQATETWKKLSAAHKVAKADAALSKQGSAIRRRNRPNER